MFIMKEFYITLVEVTKFLKSIILLLLKNYGGSVGASKSQMCVVTKFEILHYNVDPKVSPGSVLHYSKEIILFCFALFVGHFWQNAYRLGVPYCRSVMTGVF